jgi:hypothetical protein
LEIEHEIRLFEHERALLSGFIRNLSTLERSSIKQEDLFLAESVLFRTYRICERLVRVSFLHYCVQDKTFTGAQVNSKLKCQDWHTAEAILKSGNKFLDWGNVNSVKSISELVFENGFPISDMISPIHSRLVDLQRLRNFVAHDSKEAEEGFKKSRTQYLRVGDNYPQTVGELCLYRRTQRSDIVLQVVFGDATKLSDILKKL